MSTETPLFPLRSVFFPGGYLPLRIFEPRYLDMVQRCHAHGQPFGVVALTEGHEVRQREGEHFQHEQPGLIHIRTRGAQRFTLKSSRCLSHGLWVGELGLLPDDAAVAVPDDLRPASRQLQNLLTGWRERAGPEELPLQPPYAWDDAGWLANRWAELLPMPLADRQRLMAMDNPLLRLELVVDRLDAISDSASL